MSEVDERERETFEGYLRFHAFDPHGNRVEVLAEGLDGPAARRIHGERCPRGSSS